MKMNNNLYLLTEFRDRLKDEVQISAPSDYISRLKKLDRDFISKIDTATKSTPLELLKRYMTNSSNGPKKELIENFLEAIKSCLNKEFKKIKEKKDKKTLNIFNSERAAFRRSADFLSEYVDSHPYRKNKISPTEDAVITTMNGKEIILEKDDLIKNFALRIETQDRHTGDKILLPLRLIKSIVGRQLREWSKAEAQKVIIHLDKRTITINDIEKLIINTNTRETKVSLNNGNNLEVVYNPPINNIKEPLKISKLNDAHLDHEPDIDKVLKGSDPKKFPCLVELTNRIKNAKEELPRRRIDSKNCKSVYKHILDDQNFKKNILTQQFKQDLMNEIKNVSTKHVLQLASSKWNQSTKKAVYKTKQEMMAKWLDANPGKTERDWLLEVRCKDDAQREELKALFERVDANKYAELKVCPLKDYVPLNGLHVIYSTDNLPETDSKLVEYDFKVGRFKYDLDAPDEVFIVKDPKRPQLVTFEFYRWKGKQLGVDPYSFADWAWHDDINMRIGYKHWRELLKK